MKQILTRGGLIAAVLAIAAAALILPRMDEEGASLGERGPAQIITEPEVVQVRTEIKTAQVREQRLVLRGRTEALNRVVVRAETDGQIIEFLADRGDVITAGSLVARLSEEDRAANVAEAQALTAQRLIELNAARQLASNGYRSETQVAAALAAYQAAQAAVARAQAELDNILITAPIDGIVNDRSVDYGDFVERGDALIQIVRLDPMLVVAQVGELDVGALRVGAEGTARLANGAQARGRIRFISNVADAATRTFRVELEVPNWDARIPDGATAELTLPLGPVEAHLISPAALSLATDGTLGVKLVDAESRVAFTPVEILETTREGFWVTGLPAEIHLITIGHDYVQDGQEVEAVVVPDERLSGGDPS